MCQLDKLERTSRNTEFPTRYRTLPIFIGCNRETAASNARGLYLLTYLYPIDTYDPDATRLLS